MKTFIIKIKQIISIVLTFCLVIAGQLPSYARNSLAIPGEKEIFSSAVVQDLQKQVVNVTGVIENRLHENVIEIKARNQRELEKILRSVDVIKNLTRPVRLVFIMPMYNEERRLLPKSKKNKYGEDALRMKIKQLQQLHRLNPLFEWRLIVVDDGSLTADCFECAKDLWDEIQKEENLPSDRVIIERIEPDLKKGRKGGAVHYGVKRALETGWDGVKNWAEYIGYTDVDTSIDVRLAGNLFDELLNSNTDVAIASRWCRGADRTGMPVHASLSSRMFGLLAGRLIPRIKDIKDTQRSFKVFKRKVFERILPFARDNGFSFDVELLLLSRMAGYIIQEVPISWFDSNKASTLHMISDGWQMLKSIIKQRRHAAWRKVSTVFIWDEEKGILLTQQSYKNKYGNGFWEAGITEPLEPDDAYPGNGYEQAALRGLEQKLGIKAKPEDLILIGERGDYLYKHRGRERNTMGAFYAYKIPKGADIKLKENGGAVKIIWNRNGMTSKDIYMLLQVFQNDLKLPEGQRFFFSPQLEYLLRNAGALKEIYRFLGKDEITWAVDQIEIDRRIDKPGKIRSEIEKYLRHFAAGTEYERIILPKLEKLKIQLTKHFCKFRIDIPIKFRTKKFCLTFLIRKIPRKFDDDISYDVPSTGCKLNKNHILLGSDCIYEEDIIHEFEHFVDSIDILNLNDRTSCLGNVFEYLINNNHPFWLKVFKGRFESEEHKFEQNMHPLSRAKEYLIEELLKREYKYYKLNRKYKEADENTSKYFAVMLRKLFPRNDMTSIDKEAFRFIVELFREMKITREVQKIKIYPENARTQRAKIIRHNINTMLKKFINTEIKDGKSILCYLKTLRIGYPRQNISPHRYLFFIEAENVPVRGLGEYLFNVLFYGLYSLKKVYFVEAFAGLNSQEYAGSQQGYKDGLSLGETLKKRSLYRLKKHLAAFIEEDNSTDDYIGAYTAGIIRAVYPKDDKKAFEFLVSVMREVQYKALKNKNKEIKKQTMPAYRKRTGYRDSIEQSN